MKFPKLVECKSTGCHLPEEQAREVDEIVKDLPSELRSPKRKAVAELTATDEGERTDVSYISCNTVDHDKEIVIPGGMDLTVYEKNKIVLFQHDQSQPCGKCLWTKADGKGILAKTFYPAKPEKYEGEWLPEKIWGLVQAEILRGKSVTFLPLELAEPDAQQKALGAEVVFPKSLLLEYSVVSIPCCPDAVVQAVQKNLALDLSLIGMKATGQKAKKRTKRVEYIDRTPELLAEVAKIRIDPEEIAKQVLEALKNRGRI